MLPYFLSKGGFKLMDLKTLQNMKLEDLINVDLSKLTEEEMQYVERRLVKNVNRRIKRLKETGRLSASKLSSQEKKGLKAYKIPKNRVKTTKGGKQIKINVRNKLMKSAKRAQDILNKKTSKARAIDERAEQYKDVIRKTLGNSELRISDRQAKRIGKLMAKAEELYGMGTANKKLSGSPQVLQAIVDIVKARKYIKNDEAEIIIKNAITEGYESAKQLMDKLLNEDNDGFEIDDYDVDIFDM